MAVSARNHLQTRLQTILTTLSHDQPEGSFYTKQIAKELNSSLIAIFDNGIDPEPAFSGTCLGRIYLDEEKNLCLATWPIHAEKKRPWRKEILLSNVDRFEFEFLGKITANEHAKMEKIRPITPNLAWRSLWPKAHGEIPSMIRLNVEQDKQRVQFAFILPTKEPFITYEEKIL